MIFAKEPGVAFHGVRPDIRGHDTDELKRLIADIGAYSGDAIFQLLGRDGPRDPPVAESCRSSERWGSHASYQHLRATGLRRLWKACDVCKRRITALKGVGVLITPELPEHRNSFVEHAAPNRP